MRPKSSTLTGHELEMMKIVWGHERGATVRDVYEVLRAQRPIAYTTVMTGMKTLEQKGYLKAAQQDRAYVYRPARAKHQVIRGMVREFVDRVFNGSGRPLVVHLLEDEQLTESDLRDIAGIVARTGWLAAGASSLRRLRQTASPLEPAPAPFRAAGDRVGVAAEILVSDHVSGPITFGALRPVVVIPPSVLGLEPRIQEAI